MGKKKNKREYIENYLATVGKKREETNNVEKVESAKLKYGYLYKCSSYIKNILLDDEFIDLYGKIVDLEVF